MGGKIAEGADPGTETAVKLPGATGIRSVTLNVAEPDRSREFYEKVLGFQAVSHTVEAVALTPPGGGWPLLFLDAAAQLPRADRMPGGMERRVAGLYHTAYLFPSRAALGAVVSRIIASGYPIQGAADHIVSEAVYLADPEGNGIELYVDRPRGEWEWHGGQVAMATDPLDLQSLLEEAQNSGTGGGALPADTVIGHIHLQIGDLDRGEEFYSGVLGFDVTQRSYPGALFLSAGGYHHHVGLNIWGGRGIPPRRGGERGLASFRISVPDASAFSALASRAGSNVPPPSSASLPHVLQLRDSDGIAIEIERTPA